MKYRGKEIPFPAIIRVSFSRLIDSLEKQANDADSNVANFAKNLLAECAKHPKLKEGMSIGEIEENREIIQRLSRVFFPDILMTNEIKGLIPPFEFYPFFLSTRLKNILDAAGEEQSFDLIDFTYDQLYIYGCAAILAGYYHFPVSSSIPSLVDIPDKKTGIMKTYRMAMNGEMMEILPTDKAVPITKEDYYELLDNFDNVDLWKEKFPPDSYIMQGVCITNLMDVTVDHSLATITSNLLAKSADGVEKIHDGVRNLFGLPGLRIGFMMYENGTFCAALKEGMKNIVMEGKNKMSCSENLCAFAYEILIKQKKPLIVSDVKRFDELSNSRLSNALAKQPINSYIIAPIINEDEFLGFLELAAPEKYELNGASVQKLDFIIPILAMALSRFRREEQNRREAIIQQECTTIHPAVKWRFIEEANKFIAVSERNEQPVFKDIVFKHVYPLYGQLDIKGSSEKRNHLVKADLQRQLGLLHEILVSAWQKVNFPIYEELKFRLENVLNELGDELLSGSEHRVVYFLQEEIHPVLEQIKRDEPELSARVDKYFALLHPELQTIYDQRRIYDESVNEINQSLASFLDEKQLEAQKMFPHYFERYKTDGVEYNIYIGQSIANHLEFDMVFLQNLQLWQLITTCEMEYRFVNLKKKLKSDIEVASLILVYNTPLSVHFRMDEKRFDVEGAYNARYEIVKKRIDKAHVKGTSERITSPGKIAIIYTNDQDAVTYSRYISFLENKGYLKENSLEYLHVEDLQGISGLKALRVAVNYQNRKKDATLEVNELLKELQAS